MNDTIRITYIGGPTVLLEFGGLRLLTDPTFDPAGEEYTTGPVTLQKVAGPAISAEEVGSLDYVLLTHDHHSDNLDRSGRALLAQAKMALTTEEGAQRLHGNSVGLKAWESRDLPAANNRTIRVIATPARHGPAGKERGSVNGYVFFFTDTADQCVYISGDSVWYDGMAEVARRFSVQIAFLHLGAATVPAVGPFHLTMTAAEGVEAARAFSDATIVPLHFEGWAHFSEAKSDILRAFYQAGIEQRLRWPEAGRPIQLNF